uniref:T-box domain-containing protein n=1 Tax=Panagrolaimus davidi TaxID=227884 RepID=A0A914QTJ4_9BILA
MIIQKELYDRCCPAYQRVIDELEEKLIAINAPEDDIPILKQCFSIIMEDHGEFFCVNPYGKKHFKYMNFYNTQGVDDGNDVEEEDLCFPHSRLKECLRYFESETSCLPLKNSKYCRFFLDDKEMLDEYKKVMIEYGPVKLEWKNLFDFEVKNNMEDVAENDTAGFEMEEVEPLENESGDVEMEKVEPFDKKICSLFYDTYQRQNFSLPGPQIFYILNNADHRIWNNFNLSANDPGRLFISSLIRHLFRCEAKYLYLAYQSLSFDEVKFLIAHGNVVEFCLPDSKILDENGQYVHLEEIMKYLPNIENLVLPNIKVNSETGHALTKLNFNSKIFIFSIHAVFGDPFDKNEFLKFVKANRDDKLDLRMKFNGFNPNFVTKFIEIMDDYKMSCSYVETSFYIKSV